MKHNIENMIVGVLLSAIGVWMLINAIIMKNYVYVIGVLIFLIVSLYILFFYGKHVVLDYRTEKYGQEYWAIVTHVDQSKNYSDKKRAQKCGLVFITAYVDGNKKDFKEESYISYKETIEKYPVGSYLKVKIFGNDFNFIKGGCEENPPEDIVYMLKRK